MTTSRVCKTIALALLAAWGVGADEPPAGGVILTVNGDPVRAAEVRLVMPNIAGQLERDGEQVDPEHVFSASLEQVISTKLLVQQSRRANLTLDATDLDGMMGQIEERSGGREALDGALTSVGASYDDLRGVVRDAELVQRLIDVTVRPGVSVTDEEIDAFYADNPAMFVTPEQVRARHILITVADDADDAEREGARQRAAAARERALAGEDFAELAKEISQCPSAPEGGDLGYFSRASMVEPFADAAFALTPGAISDVVETRFGWHVIKLEERRAGSSRPLAEVREPLHRALVERKVAAGVSAMVERLRAGASIVAVSDQAATEG